MTISTATASASYTGNGTTQIFPVPFYFLVDTDVKVSQKVAATGVISVLTLNSDYTLTGAGNQAGGSATFVTAPTSGDTIFIERNVDAVQETAYPENGIFPAASHEKALDRLTMLVQQIKTALGFKLGKEPLADHYDVGGARISNLADATDATDAVTKQQMDAAVAGAAGGLAPDDIALYSALALASGASKIGFSRPETGAVARTDEAKLRERISVLDFGAKGDGVTDDAEAIQAALNALATTGGALYFPRGEYLTSGATLQLPAARLRLYGDGTASRLVSSADPILAYPASVTDANGDVVVQDISDLMFDLRGDNVGIALVQTWDASGKVGPTIAGCHFRSAEASAGAVSIMLTGVWSAKIANNFFNGNGFAGGAYGIRITPGAAFAGSVMNVSVIGNVAVSLQYPIYGDDRTGDGRVEGIKIVGNNLISGGTGIRFSQSNSTVISSNQISDFTKGVEFNGDFDAAIVGNTEITGATSGIELNGISAGFTERVTITGNKIACDDGGAAIRLTNSAGAEHIRKVTITGNVMNAGGSVSSDAVRVGGTDRVSAVTVIGNSMSSFTRGLNFVSAGNIAIRYGNNVYSFVTTHVNNPSNADNLKTVTYTVSSNIALSGGSTTENKDIAIPVGTFSAKPTFAVVESAFGYMLGYYDYDNASSSSTNARVVVSRKDGASISAGTYRFGIVMTGTGYVDE